MTAFFAELIWSGGPIFSAHGDVEETTSQTMSDPNIEFHHLKLGDLQCSSGDKIHGTNLILFFLVINSMDCFFLGFFYWFKPQ